jgi:hypothetical protein
MVVAAKPWPASNGVHPIAELNVVLRAYWKAGSARVPRCLYSWSFSFLIIDSSDWLILSQIEFPLGLCPPVLIWSILRYSQMAETAPVSDDSSGALSVLSDLGTPRWKITCLLRRHLLAFCC